MEVTLLALQQNDDDAWDEIAPSLAGIVLGAIKKSGGYFSRDDGLDLIQESLMELWDVIETVIDIDHLKRKLAEIAEHNATDLIRKSRAQKRDTSKTVSLERMLEGSDGADLQSTTTVPPEVKEKIELVRTAFQELGPLYRDIMWDYYFEEYTQDALMVKYALPSGTVATRLRRGKKQLDKILKRSAALKEFALEIRYE